MRDRFALQLRTALASNTGGPFTATWDRAVVSRTGTIRRVDVVAASLASNVRQNTVDIFLQTDAPAAGSNSAASVLTDPITLVNNNDSVSGTVQQANARVSRGDQLQLRTYADTTAATPAFVGLTATVEIEGDPD